jgi:hypothetical protein
MKYWVVFVYHSKTNFNEVSRMQFDQDKETAIRVARDLDGIVIYGEWIDMPKSKKEKSNDKSTILPQV